MNEEGKPGTLHRFLGESQILSIGNTVYFKQGSNYTPFVRIPTTSPHSVAQYNRLLSRFFRSAVHHVVVHQSKIVVMGFGSIFCFDLTTRALLGKPVRVEGSRPLVLCSTKHGLYYGEYCSNTDRRPVRVFYSENGLEWSEIHRFQNVRHVHGIFYDEFTDQVWATTGDLDAESVVWCADPQFHRVEKVLFGSQQTRAIPLLFRQDHIYFGSDAPEETNYIYRIDRKSSTVERLQRVEGPVYHGAVAGNWMLFSTAVEPSSVNRSPDAVLYGSSDGEQWTVLARHRKDPWHAKLFQYGQLVLPSGENATSRAWYSTFAVSEDHRIHSVELPR